MKIKFLITKLLVCFASLSNANDVLEDNKYIDRVCKNDKTHQYELVLKRDEKNLNNLILKITNTDEKGLRFSIDIFNVLRFKHYVFGVKTGKRKNSDFSVFKSRQGNFIIEPYETYMTNFSLEDHYSFLNELRNNEEQEFFVWKLERFTIWNKNNYEEKSSCDHFGKILF